MSKARGSKYASWNDDENETEASLSNHTQISIAFRALKLYGLDLSKYNKKKTIEYYLHRQNNMGVVIGNYGPYIWYDEICELEYHSPIELRTRYYSKYKEELNKNLSKEELIELFIKTLLG